MSLLFVDGCDQYTVEADISDKWDRRNAGDTNFLSTGGRYGGGAIELIDDEDDQNLAKFFPKTGTAVTTDEFGVAASFKFSGTTAADAIFFFVDQLGNIQCSVVCISSTGAIAAYRSGAGGTQLATSSAGVLIEDTYHRVECHVVVDNTVGKFVVRVDEVEVINITGQDTQNSGTFNGMNGCVLGGNTNGWHFDDIIMYTVDGSGIDDFLGDVRIQTLLPDGDGNQNDGTATGDTNNWECVDESGGADDDTTYVAQSTAADVDLFTVGNLPVTPDDVKAVVVNVVNRGDGSTARQIKTVCRSNVTEVDGDDTGVYNDTAFKTAQGFYDVDPDGGGAWDEAAVNAMEIGQEVVT